MPAETTTKTTTAKATTTEAEPKPKIGGVTSTERAKRAADERPASEATMRIMPGVADLAAELGVKKFAPKASSEEATETEEAEEEQTEEETEETEDENSETEESETEEVAENEDEKDEEEEEEATDDDDLPPEAVRIRDAMQKRIDKLTAKRGDLERQLQERDEELEELRANKPASTKAPDAPPLSDVFTLDELKARVKQAREIKQWCLKNRNGGTVPTEKEGETKSYDADEVANILANAEAEIDAADDREQWIGQSADARTIAQKQAPEFYEKGSPAERLLKDVMKSVPGHVRAWRPDIELIMIQALVGSMMLADRQDKKKGAAPKPSPKPAAPAPSAKVAPKAPKAALKQRETEKQLTKPGGGTVRNLARALESRLG